MNGTIWFQFAVEQSDGNLTIVAPQYYPQWSFTYEPGVGWKNTASTGSVAISIGILKNNRINNKYRNIVFKYSDYIGPGWSEWKSKTIKIQVNDLNISGNEPVCYSPNKTYTVSGYPGSSTFDWDKSDNLTQVGGETSSSYTVHAYSSSTSGQGDVQVTVTNSTCNWLKTRDVWVGKPLDPFNMTCQPSSNCWACPNEYVEITVSDHNNYNYTSYYWIVAGGTIISGQGEKEICVLSGSNPGTHFDKWVRAENVCGVSNYYSKYGYIDDCGGGEFLAIPNPADDYIDIIINEEQIAYENLSLANEYIMSMIDKMGILKYTAEIREFPYRISTKGLPNGLYIINLLGDGKIFSLQVIIEH
jgi:hypothetical protein